MDDETNNMPLIYTFDNDCDCAVECAEINVTEVTEEETPWSQTTINYLLEECLKKKKDLHDHRHRRNKFFAVIREKLKERGCYFNVKTLEKKFHNLKKHFYTICQHRDRATSPSRPITWHYYQQMMDIFAEELQIEDAPTMASLYPDPPTPKNLILLKPEELKAEPEPESEPEIESPSECEYEAIMDDDDDDGLEESAWTHRSVIAFLQECYKRRFDLWNPQVRRRKTFAEIRQCLKEMGYNYYQDTLDRKLRNMKTHYLTVVENSCKNGSVRRKRRPTSWPYFNLMNDIYGKATENEVTLVKRKMTEPVPNPAQPISTLKFRRIAPKVPAENLEPAMNYSVVPQIAQIFSMCPQQSVESPPDTKPSSPGEFDEHQVLYDDANVENEPSQDMPMDFETTMPEPEKPNYVGEKLKFSLDILALEARRTVVSEKMLDELIESNKIREKLVNFKRMKLQRLMARAKRRKNDSSV